MTKALFVLVCVLTLVSFAAYAEEAAQPAASAQPEVAPAAEAIASTESSLTAEKPAAPRPTLVSFKARASYAIGYSIGCDIKGQSLDVNPDILVQGMLDALTGANALMTEQELTETIQTFQQEQRTAVAEKRKQLGDKNSKEGEAFLAENAKKPGVVVLQDGLQYLVLTEGTGESPAPNDSVTVNYRGTFIDDKEFDSSYKRNQPAKFPVSGVIPGMKEALQLMKTGAKWRLFIPAKLAYGEAGAGNAIPPNSVLIFEVELVSVEKAPGATPAK